MSALDLVLLHAPSVYDFRQEMILYGPLADYAALPYALEQYPPSYTALGAYLEHAGYRVQMLNLAKRMLADPAFDVERAITALEPVAFGIDLHWLAHAQGALAVAQLVKTCHPRIPVILIGLAATYYHRELMNYPQVDYVLRGESSQGALMRLLQSLTLGQTPDQVPGITWRNRLGSVVENPLLCEEETAVDIEASEEWHGKFDNGDSSWPACLPFVRHSEEPFASAAVAKGCMYACTTCNNSAYAGERLWGRRSPTFRPPERLADDLHVLRRRRSGAIQVVGDLRQMGMDYAYRFLRAVRGVSSLVGLDLFQPAPRQFLEEVRDRLPHVALAIPIHSHDPAIRRALGKDYDNASVEQTIGDALTLGFDQVHLYFTIGLPGQDRASVGETLTYCGELLDRFKSNGRLQTFVAPLMPFLDPGSMAFEEPERTGYRLLYHNLEEHRRALLMPSWKYVLNYETEAMSRHDIVQATYDATKGMAWLRAKHGLLSIQQAKETEAAVEQVQRLMSEIDQAIESWGMDQVQDHMRVLKPSIDRLNRVGRWGRGRAAYGACSRTARDASRNVLQTIPRTLRTGWMGVKRWWRAQGNHMARRKE